MKLLLFGATGQVGARLLERVPGAIAPTRAQCDFTRLDADTLERLLEQERPSHIINAAAYTDVDKAEAEPELAQRINGDAVAVLAQAAQRHGIALLHCSTDYVLDGAGGPYRETARTNPLNAYGRSKQYGEQAALDAGARVFRLQWVYDTRGRNVYLTLRRLLAERDTLPVVADQWGAPSYAPHIAEALLRARDVPPGLYHMTAAGFTSWHGFACAIAEGMDARCTIAPILSAEYPAAATRPKDTRLDTGALAAHGIALPHWRDGLKEAMHENH